jgi:polyhydroxybutyrate depolymerase
MPSGLIRSVHVALLTLVAASGSACAEPAFQSRSLPRDGETRTWSEIIPPACTAVSARCPLVVALHGGGGRTGGAQFASGTGLADEAAARSYILLAPDALGDNWNDGRPEMAAGIDDVGFIRAMIADVRTRAGVDPARIFATGASNGGLMSYRLACESGGLFRAVAPVIANMGEWLIGHCSPVAPVSLLMMPGTADPLIRYAGGPVAAGARDRGRTVSSDRTLDYWRGAMDCAGPPRVEHFDPVRDSTSVTITRFDTCDGGARVRRWTVEGGGHTWPGRPPAAGLRARLVGPTASEFSATKVIMDFFDSMGAGR